MVEGVDEVDGEGKEPGGGVLGGRCVYRREEKRVRERNMGRSIP